MYINILHIGGRDGENIECPVLCPTWRRSPSTVVEFEFEFSQRAARHRFRFEHVSAREGGGIRGARFRRSLAMPVEAALRSLSAVLLRFCCSYVERRRRRLASRWPVLSLGPHVRVHVRMCATFIAPHYESDWAFPTPDHAVAVTMENP